jgi:hypothetical protein
LASALTSIANVEKTKCCCCAAFAAAAFQRLDVAQTIGHLHVRLKGAWSRVAVAPRPPPPLACWLVASTLALVSISVHAKGW